MLSIRNVSFVAALYMVVSLCGCARELPPSVSVNDATISSVRSALEVGVSSGDAEAAEVLADQPVGRPFPVHLRSMALCHRISHSPSTRTLRFVRREAGKCWTTSS